MKYNTISYAMQLKIRFMYHFHFALSYITWQQEKDLSYRKTLTYAVQ